MTDQRRFAVIILAAGQGTRMRSDTHKVLHPIASRPLLLHLLDTVDRLGAEKRVVVVGKGREQVEAAIQGRDVSIAIQSEQKGTGHAVQQAAEALAGYEGPVIVLYGDTPFVEADTLRRMLDRLENRLVDGVLTIAASEHRAQLQNRAAARERLAAILRSAAAPPPPMRKPTKPTKGSKERRIAGKKRRAETKRGRSGSWD